MTKLIITSNGTPEGTIVSTEDGEIINNVSHITWECDAMSMTCFATIRLAFSEVALKDFSYIFIKGQE